MTLSSKINVKIEAQVLFTFSCNWRCILEFIQIYNSMQLTFNEPLTSVFLKKFWTIYILLTFDATITGLLCLIASALMAL